MDHPKIVQAAKAIRPIMECCQETCPCNSATRGCQCLEAAQRAFDVFSGAYAGLRAADAMLKAREE